MSHSLTKLYTHIIFHIKDISSPIRKSDTYRLYSYIGAILNKNESIPIQIGGTTDHIHILCVVSKNISLAKLVEEIKRNSSRWIKTVDPFYCRFAWQSGYGAFSVSPSVHSKTVKYIKNQEQHHRKMSFREEYILFLKEYEIEYNEKYLWNG
ncbi:MAG: transposase [Tannerellaceae bacterium]|nr:transposase [Tannerellaceae bacterium]